MKKQIPQLILSFLFLFSLNIGFSQNQRNIEKDTTVLTFAEQMPEFPGGNDSMYRFLSRNIHYPALARENGIEGRCILTFVVCDNGTICNIESVGRRAGWGLDEEAIRVIKAMPAWTPGKQNGKPVFVKFTLPIRYELPPDSTNIQNTQKIPGK